MPEQANHLYDKARRLEGGREVTVRRLAAATEELRRLEETHAHEHRLNAELELRSSEARELMVRRMLDAKAKELDLVRSESTLPSRLVEEVLPIVQCGAQIAQQCIATPQHC